MVMQSLTARATEDGIHADPMVRSAREERRKGWIRFPVTIVVSSFLFEFASFGVGATWLLLVLALEVGATWTRYRLASGDLRYRPLTIGFTVSITFAWIVHALILWNQPEELARIATVIDLLTIALYGAIGSHTERRIMTVLMAAPLLTLCAIIFHFVWTEASVAVAITASLATIGSCVLILANGWSLHQTGVELHRAHVALEQERDSLEVRVRERTRDLELATARAEAASTAKSVFLATMSHELRSPLNAVIGYAEMIAEDIAAGDPPNAADADNIRSSGARLLRLINDVLDLASVEAGQMQVALEPANIGDVLTAAAHAVAPLAAEHANSIETQSDPLFFSTDAKRLLQCVTHIADNACKFTRNGSVRLSARVVESKERRSLEIVVTDTGCGMNRALAAELFRPFMQGDQSFARHHEGAGLGLAITKRVLNLLEGQIAIDTAPGRGTRVTLLIPEQRERA